MRRKRSQEDLLRIIGNTRLEQERYNAYERLAGRREMLNTESIYSILVKKINDS